ncbi:ATP-binding protein [Streptomyces sp. AD681]|uniref:ATP-binding protein n=1 Tax=Streptomyces sp. AD681 TaxID=3019069 RepID=UPI0022F145E0|nr:ATP-binding protein [Streptomyces sp. AD681]MDA5141114.1 ATP-binding protein [Streptomyces sp. AD681]
MSTSIPRLPAATRTFTLQFSSTRRGARLARLLTYEQLRSWKVSPGVADRAEQIVAELAANAALHSRVQGRDFRLTLANDSATGVLRVAVTDARGDQLPPPVADFIRPSDDESGRGLLIVAALADRWGSDPYPPSGKTVWAECDFRAAGHAD